MTTPTQVTVLNHHMANQCTKSEVPSFSHSGDMLDKTDNLNELRDYNHALFRDGLSSVGWD